MTDEQPQSWWDGNRTRAWRILVMLLLGIFSFLGARIYDKVDAMPEKYATKTSVTRMADRIDCRLDSIDSQLREILKYQRDVARGK